MVAYLQQPRTEVMLARASTHPKQTGENDVYHCRSTDVCFNYSVIQSSRALLFLLGKGITLKLRQLGLGYRTGQNFHEPYTAKG